MKKITKFFYILALAFVIQCSTPVEVAAQCPMCRMSAEQNLKAGGTAGKGLNNGIIYLLLTPYIVITCIGFVWWRNRKSEEELMQA